MLFRASFGRALFAQPLRAPLAASLFARSPFLPFERGRILRGRKRRVFAGSIVARPFERGSLTHFPGPIIAGAVVARAILARAHLPGTLVAGTLVTRTLLARAVVAGTLVAGTVLRRPIVAGTVLARSLQSRSVLARAILAHRGW